MLPVSAFHCPVPDVDLPEKREDFEAKSMVAVSSCSDG